MFNLAAVDAARTVKVITYRIELANKIVCGRTVGNLYGVARLINGCRNTWVLQPQESRDAAILELAILKGYVQ